MTDSIHIGDVKSELTVIGIEGGKVIVRCSCGKTKALFRCQYQKPSRKTCGRRGQCKAYERLHPLKKLTSGKKPELIGKRFGSLVITEVLTNQYGGSSGIRALAKCDCGKTKLFVLHDIESGRLKTCGCYRIQIDPSWKLALYTRWGERRLNRRTQRSGVSPS